MRASTLAFVSLLLGVAVACSSAGSGATDSACSSLGACCATASAADQASCFQLFSAGNSTACAEELVTLQTTGACGSASPGGGAGTGCTGLAACCAEMTGIGASDCSATASAGVATVCTAELTGYQSSGACHATTTGPGSGPGGGTGCAALATCCASQSGSAATACDQIVATGVASTCSAELTVEEATGACSTVSPGSGTGARPGSGTGVGPGSGTGVGPGSGSGTGGSSGTGSGSGSSPMDAGAPVDCAPHALPAGFTFRTIGLPGGSCTSAQDEGINSCMSAGTTCSAYDVGSCATCAFTEFTSSSWGPFAYVTTAGAGQVVIPFYNFAGCLMKIDPLGGTACARAVDQAFECELAACLPYCPIASSSDTAGEDALLGTSTTNGCVGDADSSICAQYVDAENTACAALSTDAGTGPADKCDTILNATDEGPFVALFCGGEDAGL